MAALNKRRTLAVALGSNIGDRVANIEGALSYLEQKSDIRVLDTSFLYETSPMYVTDQPRFINGACLISSSLHPQALINLMKDAEDHQGRQPTYRNGPRVVDLDIIFDEDQVYDIRDVKERELTVPHPQIQNREFVLRPLADIIPNFLHPVLNKPISILLSQLPAIDNRQVLHFPTESFASLPGITWPLGESTRLMATLNTTPDSFSDGGLHNSIHTALKYAQNAVNNGADMIDIGGYSTRPGSTFVSPSEEIERTVPYITCLRKEGIKIPISVDTFRAEVAQQCLAAGANCINDVYALSGPHVGVANATQTDATPDACGVPVSDGDAMLKVAAQARVPVILMHSRGQANQNKDYTMFSGGVVEGVRTELSLRAKRALVGGVRRWNIVLDPGIGFSKTVKDNLVLIRSHSLLAQASSHENRVERRLPTSPRADLRGFPTLVGTSRKGYLAEVIGRAEAKQYAGARDWATAAAITSAIQQSCDIIRVHNVQGMKDVVKVADALWRK